MSNFSILHLSDLHICSKTLSGTNKKLIVDILEQTKNIDKLIIAISGDIVDKGEYAKYVEGAKLFFDKLKEGLENKVKGIYIVPGNHDKTRSISNRLYGELNQINTIEMTEEIWKLQDQNYLKYLELAADIKKIFKKRPLKKTFGVECCEVGENIVCLIEFDTSWATFGGKKEDGNLIIGKYQLDYLLQEYIKLKEKLQEKNKEITLTIGMAHHPISWLKPEEEKMIRKYMIDEEYLNVDLFLCGHIHDMEIENWFDHEHSVMTLVTGIGWNHQNTQSNEKDKKDEHRYSIYTLDAEKNSCEIVMRRSNRNGKFINDTSIYTNNSEEAMKKLCYPIHISNEKQPFIRLNAPADSEIQSLLVDEKILEKIKKVSLSLSEFQKRCMELLMFYKREYLERLEDFYEVDSAEYTDAFNKLYNSFFKESESVKKDDAIFKKDPSVTYELFTSFLQEVTNNFVSSFNPCFEENSNLRVHFRWYDRTKDQYRQLCKYSSVEQDTGPTVSSIKWGGLIEQAYLKKKSFIYSVNSQYNKHKPVKWNDFMTIVPLFFKSELEFRDKDNKKIKRPIMTFGISVLNSECPSKELSEILYILEYLELGSIVTGILDDFMNCFIVDYSEYLVYISQL